VTRAAAETGVLSRDELDALLAEMPALLAEHAAESEGASSPESDLELERANEAFGFEYGRMLSNRHERVLQLSLIGHRPIELAELAELMLPTDVVASFQIQPKGHPALLLLSRPFFFQMLCMLFGAGAGIKPVRPPTREYTRIERRFYARIAKEMLARLEEQWQALGASALAWNGILPRSSVGELPPSAASLATFEVRGFSEPCRVRIAVPVDALRRAGSAPARTGKPALAAGVSLQDVPIRLRARVGTVELSLAEVGRLAVGQSIPLEVEQDGLLTVQVGDRDRFRGIAGTRGSKRAVQLQERIEGAE